MTLTVKSVGFKIVKITDSFVQGIFLVSDGTAILFESDLMTLREGEIANITLNDPLFTT